MWSVWGFVSFFASTALAHMSPYYFCADMEPQQFINIAQLMGMWYGIEILTHNVDHHYVQIGSSCPVLYISKDKDPPVTTHSPLYNDYNYGYNYGERRPPSPRPTDRAGRTYEYNQYGRRVEQPETRNPNNRHYGTTHYNPREYPHDIKRIIISWHENGTSIDYRLKYNITKPGFWISSGPQNGKIFAGPQNGSELEPVFTNFAGTVQVIKVVGTHMVLTFCHQLPDKQLFTVLLSRENKLTQHETHSVHNMLHRKGLTTTAVRKVCWNGSVSVRISLGTLLLIFSLVLHF